MVSVVSVTGSSRGSARHRVLEDRSLTRQSDQLRAIAPLCHISMSSVLRTRINDRNFYPKISRENSKRNIEYVYKGAASRY